MKTLVLIDGEHYPPVTRDAVESIRDDVRAAVFLGGTEKIGDTTELTDFLNLPIYHQSEESSSNIFELIVTACEDHDIEQVIDLSDEPVVDYTDRFKIASYLMRKGVQYLGSDFLFTPPAAPRILNDPSLAVIGTTKRVGKTAISGFVARTLKENGYNPCIVTMGRGGPAEPEVIRGDLIELNAPYLLAQADKGKHAASDHWENGLISRVVTIGCRRCGGGMAGAPFVSNVTKGAKIANELDVDFAIMEGSGITLPPVHADGYIVIVGAHQPVEFINNYFGPYRILKANMVILMMCEEPMATPEKVKAMAQAIDAVHPKVKQAHCVFRPRPLTPVQGKKVALTTTAPPAILEKTIVPYLEKKYECTVVGASPHLSHRPLLRKDLNQFLPSAEVLLTEIKASAIDVATREAAARGIETVYMDNIPHIVGGTITNLKDTILQLAQEVST